MGCEIREFGLCSKCDEHEFCTWGASLKSLLISSMLPKAQWVNSPLSPEEVDYDAFERLAEIGSTIESIVKSGSNLVICSNNTGNGKTSWAIKLLQKYLISISANSYLDPEQHIYHGCFVPTTQFVFDAKDFNGPYRDRYTKLAERADKSDFTIYDDIGAAEYSKYDYTTLLVSIDRRVFSHKFCVFTTNFIEKRKLANAVGTRLADRIWDTSEIITFKGKGVRC